MKTCKSCNTSKPASAFNKQKDNKDGLKSNCKECQKKYNTKYYKIEAKALKREEYLLNWRYGVSREVLDNLYKEQEGKCAICGEFKLEYNKRGGLYVDHCHTTGKVRGLLCNYCNSVIGMAKDDPSILLKAIEYLIKKKG